MILILEALLAGMMVLLAFLILTNPRGVNRSGNFWLGLVVASIAMETLDNLFLTHRFYALFPHLIGVPTMLFFFFPPALYLATLFYAAPLRSYQRHDWLHFIFFAINLIVQGRHLFTMDAQQKLAWISIAQPKVELTLLMILQVAYVLIYCGLAVLTLWNHQRRIVHIVAAPGSSDLRWFSYFLLGALVVASNWVALVLTHMEGLQYSTLLLLLMLMFYLSFAVLRQGEVYNFNPADQEKVQGLLEDTGTVELSKKHRMSPERQVELVQQLEKIMVVEQPYLDNELSLPKLAQMLDTNLHTLSFVINEHYGENFSQYINRYRINEAQKMLADAGNDHLSILGIAYEVGFNSKTAFNTAFKKITGLSPTAFKLQRAHR